MRDYQQKEVVLEEVKTNSLGLVAKEEKRTKQRYGQDHQNDGIRSKSLEGYVPKITVYLKLREKGDVRTQTGKERECF